MASKKDWLDFLSRCEKMKSEQVKKEEQLRITAKERHEQLLRMLDKISTSL